MRRIAAIRASHVGAPAMDSTTSSIVGNGKPHPSSACFDPFRQASKVLWFGLDDQPLPTQVFCCHSSSASSAEWIKNQVTRARHQLDEKSWQLNRKSGWVAGLIRSELRLKCQQSGRSHHVGPGLNALSALP